MLQTVMCDFIKGNIIKGFYTLSESHVTFFIYASTNPKVEKKIIVYSGLKSKKVVMFF